MGADLATLERKVDAVVATQRAMFELVLAKLDAMDTAGKPGITQVEFATLIKVHPRTVCRWVKAKKIRLERGLVPNSEVRKHLS